MRRLDLDDVIAGITAGVLLVDHAWIIHLANAAAVEMLGRGGGDLKGSFLPAMLEGGAALLAKPGPRGHSRVLRSALAGAGGKERSLEVSVVPLVGATEGGADAWVVTLQDVGARLGLESEARELRARLEAAERDRARLSTVQAALAGEGEPPVMIGSSAALRRVREQVARVAPTDTTVLIHGETGTGKELVARSIQAASRRAGRAYVAVNCAALPETLIESELFGHERGAFTGADRRRLGKFEVSDEGTLFLDEVAELPLQAQAKLLRVIQDGTFERVGGTETIRVDVRLVAATHRDLARQVELGRFREDLFYRLNVFRIDVPSLRDRLEDLRALVEHLHERVARRMARPVLPVSEGSMRRVVAYHWPGNVRELANAVERATLLAEGPELEIELPESPRGPAAGAPGVARGVPFRGASGAGDILLDLTMEQLQRLHIVHALERCGYRVFGPGGAAERLEMHPSTLLSRMDRFGIPRPRLMRGGRPGSRGG